MDTSNFIRIEKKYLLNEDTYSKLVNTISSHIIPDKYGKYTIESLYLDTPNNELIRNSIEAINYKEKLRLRSYGTPNKNDKVFLEIKKKFDGVVYKRREKMSIDEAKNFIRNKKKPFNSQIINELDYSLKRYDGIDGACVLSYEREAFSAKDDESLRITFDRNIRYRFYNLDLSKGSDGKHLLKDDEVLMEIKTNGAMPLYLAHTLNELNIVPTSFSKYGTAYKEKCGLKG